MKFDCIVSNAPYDNGLHEKFESKYFDICNIILENKKLCNKFKETDLFLNLTSK